jgi:virulence factor Mce-like protein
VKRRLLLAGLCVAVASALPACGLVGGGDTYTLTAYFDRAVSVFPSSDVRILGLPAGSVSEVEIEGDQVRVVMHIPADIAVPADATAQIVPQSLIGERYIQISPAFKEGMARATDGDEIERTIIPVEPDEALAALKEFLDSLNPDRIGELITNLDEDLQGNGANLNTALGGLSQLVQTFAEKDDVLLRIVDSFDRLSATLVTREQQLGEVMDAFAQASEVLANERESIESLVAGLADLSRNGLALIGEHAGPLRADIATLADAAATIDANLTSVTQLLAAGPALTSGFIGAYNPQLRALNLRNNFSPLATDIVKLLGIDFCLPILQDCPASGLSQTVATPAEIATPVTPIGSLLSLLDAPTATAPTPAPALGVLDRTADFLGDAASTLLGVGQ